MDRLACVLRVFLHTDWLQSWLACVIEVFLHTDCSLSWLPCVFGVFLHTETSFIRGAAGSVGDVGKGRGFPSRLLDG